MRYKTAALSALLSVSHAVDLNVASSGGNMSSPMMYGVMFEDINYSGDGGIYAELVQNRAFQGSEVFPSTLTAYRPVGDTSLSLQNLSDPLSWALPTSMRVSAGNSTSEQVGFLNEGWWGMDVQVQPYNGSFYAKGDYSGKFTVELRSNLTDETFGSVEVDSACKSGEWVLHEYTLTPDSAAPNSNNTLVVTFDKGGVGEDYLDFNLISLFPPTYNNRPNGLRTDLMETLAELSPSFFRFPGGNNLEGDMPPYLWYWNQTLGSLTERPGRPGTWSYENTDGLGLVEYLLWAEDLGMEPILGLWAGLYLDGTVLTPEELQPWIQYALDELEFLMGDESTTWGARRIALGYPDPWPINYVEIGNEDNLNDGLESYNEYRFPMFYDAIKAVYPEMVIIASTVQTFPTRPNDNSAGDYHQYTRPDMFVEQFGFFDNYTTQHPIIVGEYATTNANVEDPDNQDFDDRIQFPSWIGSVGEAIFLLGTERNGNKVFANFYAPTFQNLNAFQWVPDQISYTADPSQTVRSTSHYLSALFSYTRISETLPIANEEFGPAYYVAGKNEGTGQHIVKAAVYNSSEDVPFHVNFEGVGAGTKANLTYLTAPDGLSYNDIGKDVVEVTTQEVTADGDGTFTFSLPELSIAVFATEMQGGEDSSGGHDGRKWGGHNRQWNEEWKQAWKGHHWGKGHGKGRGHYWKA
ncbi:hypothetical protein MBLNU230_g5713t1 [Neophaeotheca triangularis]